MVDRAAVGQRVFTDPDELTWLEAPGPPAGQDEIADWFGGLPGRLPVAVVEVPLLFEGEMADRFDATVAIVADEALRRERARARGHAGLDGREARQLTQDEKADRADRVVVNDGTTADLEDRLRELLAELRRRAADRPSRIACRPAWLHVPDSSQSPAPEARDRASAAADRALRHSARHSWRPGSRVVLLSDFFEQRHPAR